MLNFIVARWLGATVSAATPEEFTASVAQVRQGAFADVPMLVELATTLRVQIVAVPMDPVWVLPEPIGPQRLLAAAWCW